MNPNKSSSFDAAIQVTSNALTAAAATAVSTTALLWTFILKSASQTQIPAPNLNFSKKIRFGLNNAPAVSATIAGQVAIAEIVEKALFNQETNSTTAEIAAAAAASAITTPGLKLLNDRTMHPQTSFMESLFSNKKASGMLFMRELAAIIAIRGLSPVNSFYRDNFGDSPASKLAAQATTCAIAVAASHPLDTIATRSSAGLTTTAIDCARGFFPRLAFVLPLSLSIGSAIRIKNEIIAEAPQR